MLVVYLILVMSAWRWDQLDVILTLFFCPRHCPAFTPTHRSVNTFVLNKVLLWSLTDGAFYRAFVQPSPRLLLQRWTQRARCHHFHQRPEDFISERRQRRHQKGQQTEHSRAKGERGPDPHGCSGGDRPLTPPTELKLCRTCYLKGGFY